MNRLLGQRGFAAVEAVLVVVILAIVGGTGYYVYHSNKKAGDTLDSASKTVAASGASNRPNGGKGGGGGDSKPQTGPAKTEVFIINEWGVSSSIPTPPEQAALIQYKIVAGSNPASAKFTTQELIDADMSCSADSAPAGIVSRAKPSDQFYLSDGSPAGKTVAQELATGTFTPYKQVNGYYYWYEHAQAGCGDPTKTAPLQTLASNEVKQIVSHLEKE